MSSDSEEIRPQNDATTFDNINLQQPEEEEEESEPRIKYQRLSNAVPFLLSADDATSFSVTDRFICIGTRSGAVVLMDVNGNCIKTFRHHQHQVNSIDIDGSNEYIVSGGEDGNVHVYSLYSDDVQQFKLKQSVRCVSFDPNFARKPSRPVACGLVGGQLVMCEKGIIFDICLMQGWFGVRENVLHVGSGIVTAVNWNADFIAWADNGIKIIEIGSNEIIMNIQDQGNTFPYHLVWRNDVTLMMGWMNNIRIGLVKEKSRQDVVVGSKYVEMICSIQTDFIVCGLGPFESQMVVFAFMHCNNVVERPEIRLYELQGEEVAVDVLTIQNYKRYTPSDYHLICLRNDAMFYVMNPKDVIVCHQRDVEDHLTWLIDHGHYEQAMEAVDKLSNPSLKRQSVVDVGQKYLEWLGERGEWEKASKLARKVLDQDPALWEKWIFYFAQHENVHHLSSFIPIDSPRLSTIVYDRVLESLLSTQVEIFKCVLDEWPCRIYSLPQIISRVQDRLMVEPESKILIECMAILYLIDQEYEKALRCYLKLKKESVYQLILQHDLFHAIANDVVLFMKLDEDLPIEEWKQSSSVQLLIHNTDKIPVDMAVGQLIEFPLVCFIYLDALYAKDPFAGCKYHDQQILLYAEYEYCKLMDFLKTSNDYSLDKALMVCRERDLVPETVFLLGRLGQLTDALKIIIQHGNVQQVSDMTCIHHLAIEFAMDHNDDELWNSLIDYSIDKPDFVLGLLQNAGAKIEARAVIEKLPSGLHIPHLKETTVALLHQYHAKLSLQQGCQTIFINDSIHLTEILHKKQRMGHFISTNTACGICTRLVFDVNAKYDDIVVFRCNDCYHKSCLVTRHSFCQRTEQEFVCFQCEK